MMFVRNGTKPAPPSDPRPDIETVIADEPRAEIAEIIAANDGCEVFFVGKLDDGLVVEEVIPCAFGNDEAVPAITQMADDGDVVIHNHPSGTLKPSDVDIQIASTVGDRSIGFYIVDNACLSVHVVVPAFERERLKLLDPARIEELLGREGVLARNMSAYEFRQPQIDMAGLVCRAFNEEAVAIVEAGTGTGKSMAYLLPSALWAVDNKEKVVVSTNTINLQEQLISKDLPFLARNLGLKLRAELVKGRGNYVCLRKLEEAESHVRDLLEPALGDQFKTLYDWAKTTKDGSLADLNFRPDDDLWEEVRSEPDSCLRAKCKRYRDCHFYRARRRASSAHVLVVNHALLLTDLALRKETGIYSQALVLPPYRRLVLDEGHNVEEAATRAFSSQVTATGLKRMCHKWSNPAQRGRGVLSAFMRRLDEAARGEDPEVLHKIGDLIHEQLGPGSQELASHVDDVAERLVPPFLEHLERVAGSAGSPQAGSAASASSGPAGSPQAAKGERETGAEWLLAKQASGWTRQLRVTGAVRAQEVWIDHVEPLTRQLAAAIGHFANLAMGLNKQIKNLSKSTLEKMQSATLQVESHTNRMSVVAAQLYAFLAEDANTCAWLEYAQSRRAGVAPALRWRTAPIELGPLLKEALFDPTRTAVVTSATLTVAGKFDYLLSRLGLAPGTERGDFPFDAGVATSPYRSEDREWDPDAPQFADSGAGAEEVQPPEAGGERPILLETIESPFDYTRQAFVAAPRDVPDPRDREYERAVAECVERAVRISHGRAFVLFTSYGMLNRTAARLEERLRADGFTMLRQGETARHLLLQRFRQSPKAVLFATSSFWEGVDVQGDALVLLILARLPFSVPSEPVLQARIEAIENRGGDPFREFSVPTAVIRFKQGFGRLIRSRSDTGAVLILDSRVVRQSYGRAFLNSLPTHETWKGRTADLWPALERFFNP